MDGPVGKTLTVEERKKVKEKLALLKKEYNQTVRRLQRSQKAERVKIHVKKTIEEQNRFLSQNETEVSITDSAPSASVLLQVSADGSDVDAHRRTAVTFNLKPEVFCIEDRIGSSHCPGSNLNGQENKFTVDKVPERSQRSRLKLRRSSSSLKRRDSDTVPLSCEVSSLSGTPYLPSCLRSQELELQPLVSSVCKGSTFTPKHSGQPSEDNLPEVGRNDMGGFMSQKQFLNGSFPEHHMGINRLEEPESLSVDLSTASLESTPLLIFSPTPDPLTNREEVEASSLILDQEEHQINGSSIEPASYFCFSNKSAKSDLMENLFSAGRQPCVQDEHIFTQSQLPSSGNLKADASQQVIGTQTGDVTVAPDCVPSSVTVESPLNSCTLIDGLLFPVEYYVRTTRRMSSLQRKVDLDAVIQSQLGTNRKACRSKIKNFAAEPEKVAFDSTNQKDLMMNSEMLLVDANENNACLPGIVKTGGEANSQSASQSYVPMTQISATSSRKKGRRKAPGRGRKKSRSSGKLQIDVDQKVAATDSDKILKLTEGILKTDYQSKKEHICKTTQLSLPSCTLAASNARHQEPLSPTSNSNPDKIWVMRSVERTQPLGNSTTLWTESADDDLRDFETDLNFHQTPKRRTECISSCTKTPLLPATQHLTAASHDPLQNVRQSRQLRNKGKAMKGIKFCLLQESSEGADSPVSVVSTPQVWSSVFSSPDERFSLNKLPFTLNIQDFHLPDEEFGLLKLEKLKSCCVPPLEEFVCPVSKEESRANQVLCESPASDFGNRLNLELLEKGVSEIEMQNQTYAIRPIIVDAAAYIEQEKLSVTSEAFHQQKARIEDTDELSYTDEAAIREQTAVLEPESHSYSGTPPGVSHVNVSKPDAAVEDLYTDEALFIKPVDQSCRSVTSVEELTTLQQNWDQLYAFRQSFSEDSEPKAPCDQIRDSQDLIGEHVAVQGVSQAPPTDQDHIIEQTSNGGKIHELHPEGEVQEDDLVFFAMSLDELSASQWQEPFTQVQPNREPCSSHLLSTPLATVLPNTDCCNEVSLCTPALPILGVTPAFSTCNSISTSSWDIETARPQTEVFCGQKADVVLPEHENDAFVCSLDGMGDVTRNVTSLGKECAAFEPCSQKRYLRPKALCETNRLNIENGLLQVKAGTCEASKLHSKMRHIKSESEQCETSEPFFDKRPLLPDLGLYETNESQNAAFSKQALHKPTEICDRSGEPARTYKTNYDKAVKTTDLLEMPASAELFEWPAGMWHGSLQLLSQIQPSGSFSYAVDLSTVWWDIDGWRDMCAVIATESTVSLWKPLDGGKWEIANTWNSPKLPILQLIPLPNDCNFVCVALGKLDIEEIWALSYSPEHSGLSALLVKHGHTPVVRGLTGRRLVCSSGRHPEQLVEVLFLSEVGRSLDTRYMWPPGETLLSFAEVEGEQNALVGTTAANNAVIWNTSSGQLLKKIPIENCHQPSFCLQAYSELGLLFLVLSHPHVHESENSKRSVLSLIAANPKEALSVHVMSYMLPNGCYGRFREGDLKDNTAAVVLTTGTIVLWDLHLGHCTALLPATPRASWSLVRWCQVDSHLLTGQKDGSVSVYKYFESCGEKT